MKGTATMIKLLRIAFCLALPLGFAGCGGEASDADGGNIVVLECGPNARLHGGLGNAEPHCDCVDGFKLYDGNCIPEDTQAPGATNVDSSDGSNPPADNADDSPMREPRPTTRALPATCWRPPGSECDPRGAIGCDLDAGETCDIAQTPQGEPNLVCLQGPNPQGLGDPCEPSSGPFCGAGLHCAQPGICKRFCCDDSECMNGLNCLPFADAAGTLGLCDDGDAAPAPACGPPGASCRSRSECCSNDCHAGHCH